MNIIQKLIPLDDLKTTIMRFPLSILCSVAIFIIGVGMIHEMIEEGEDTIGKIVAALGLCYFWFGIARIVTESQGWPVRKHMFLALPVAGAIAAIMLYSSTVWITVGFVLPALLLLIMVAPYMTGGDDLSFWFFNRMVWFGVFVSYATLILFAGGLSLAMVSVHELFGLDIDEKFYVDIWLFASFVLGPVYALSWVPKKFEFEQKDCADPPGLQFIVNWVAAPMIMIYLLILYAYFAKILIDWELPNGYLAYMITGFAGAGTVVYLAGWPLREEGPPLLRLFYRIFFPALIIPAGFHFFAIWERVNAYGLTEQRYMLVLSALWLLTVSLSFTFFRRMPLRTIPWALAILFILGSFGPWSGANVSGYSQISRLESLLVKHNLLVDGKIVKAAGEIPFDDRLSISSILDYLCRSDRGAMIAPWFNAEKTERWACSGYTLTRDSLGFDYVTQYDRNSEESGRFHLRARSDGSRDVRGYDFLVVNKYAHNNCKQSNCAAQIVLKDKRVLKIYLTQDGRLVVRISEKDILEADLKPIVLENRERQNSNEPLYFEVENDKIAVRFDVAYVNGEMKDGILKIDNVSFDFLYRLRENPVKKSVK